MRCCSRPRWQRRVVRFEAVTGVFQDHCHCRRLFVHVAHKDRIWTPAFVLLRVSECVRARVCALPPTSQIKGWKLWPGYLHPGHPGGPASRANELQRLWHTRGPALCTGWRHNLQSPACHCTISFDALFRKAHATSPTAVRQPFVMSQKAREAVSPTT